MTPDEIACSILNRLELPAVLRGRYVNLVGFPDDKTCRQFYPGRSLDDHEHACRLVAMEVAKRGGRTCRTIKACLNSDDAATHSDRTHLADQHTYLVPIPGSVTPRREYDHSTCYPPKG